MTTHHTSLAILKGNYICSHRSSRYSFDNKTFLLDSIESADRPLVTQPFERKATMRFQHSVALVIVAVSSAEAFVHQISYGTARQMSTTSALRSSRQPIMAGNWKMNPATEEDALALSGALTKLLGEETCAIDDSDELCTEVVVFPPHPFISKVKDAVEEVGIAVGAQSIFFEDKGAYTGSVAASMVKSIGCQYVLCGHSERRTLFNDDDMAISKKVKKVLEMGMKPILCIGETKDEYDLKIKNEVCAMQLSKDLVGVSKEQMKNVVIA
jgi:Triosephosphate isomerase